MVQEATKFVAANKDKPFFLYWPINTPHYPLQGTDKWRERYADLPEPRRQYAAFVSTTDEKIGQLLAAVDDLGLTDDTIVVFQSDHGHSTEERTFGGGGSAGVYRGAKFSLFEGGIRVPAIVSYPGTLPEDEVRDQFAVSVDWLPTVAELCKVSLPDRKLDGASLTKVIASADTSAPRDVFHWQSGRGLGGKPQWAVRSGDWKLIGNPKDTSNKAPITKDDALFLVNLAADPSEMKNVAPEHPEIVERLQEQHDQWLEEVEQQ